MLYDQRWDKQLNPLEAWRQTLFDAADYLDEHGWCQRVNYDGCGRACIFGALGKVSLYSERTYYEAALALSKHIGGRVASWNDALGRTKGEVVDTIRECARQD